MKNWALLVAALYVLILVALTLPVLALAFAPNVGWTDLKWPSSHDLACLWPYWLWLAVMGLSQFALLAVPVRIAELRPVTRGPLWPTVLAAGLMAGGLVLGASLAILEFIHKGEWGNWCIWLGVLLGALTWFAWSLIFFRMGRQAESPGWLTRLCRLLFKGSILELLIAVPTHVVARYRNYCCAGFMTFIGLAMGISVMLFSFGPAVFFLFADRWKRLHPPASGEQMKWAA